MKRNIVAIAGLLVLLAALVVTPALAADPDIVYPDLISLPDGFQPEGIVTGNGARIYAGSLADGSIYQANLLTGRGSILVPGQEGRTTVGLSFDARTKYIFAAGGPSGQAYVFDARTGAEVAMYQLTTEAAFINDVIVTDDAAYFTNSFTPVFYRLPLSNRGELPNPSEVAEIAMNGFPAQQGFNSNGIEAAPEGRYLIIVHSGRGELYRVDPLSGEASLIDLGGGSVTNGDGILLRGSTLYVMQNRLNQIAVVELNRRLTAGTISGTLTNANFDVPTTLARAGRTLFAVNARFGNPDPTTASYDIVSVNLP